jgi:hypothetical protein
MRDALQPIVLSRAYGAAFPYALLRFVSPLGPTPRFPLEKQQKRTHLLHRLGTAWFLVPSSEPDLARIFASLDELAYRAKHRHVKFAGSCLTKGNHWVHVCCAPGWQVAG